MEIQYIVKRAKNGQTQKGKRIRKQKKKNNKPEKQEYNTFQYIQIWGMVCWEQSRGGEQGSIQRIQRYKAD